MSRSFSMFVVTMFVAGAAGAQAHQLNPLGVSVPTGYVSATGATAAAQGDDLAAKVKAALKADPAVGEASDAVTVTAAAGVVTLEGTVPSVQIRAKIAEFAMKVEGVSKLVNKLKLAKK